MRTLTQSEARTLRRGLGFSLIRVHYANLGEIQDKTPEWCSAVVDYVVEESNWAPEIDWLEAHITTVRLSSRENAEWLSGVARKAGRLANAQSSRVLEVLIEARNG